MMMERLDKEQLTYIVLNIYDIAKKFDYYSLT
jgi:hypothetical protein